MSANKKNTIRILFVSHDASLTGAPVLLYNLLTLLKRNNRFEIAVVLKRGGHLEEKFRELFPVYKLRSDKFDRKTDFISRVRGYLCYRFNSSRLFFAYKRPDFVFNNTVANGRLLKRINRLQVPVLTYVHELESVIREFEVNGDSQLTFKYSDIFICPSNAVAENLRRNHHVSDIQFLKYYFPFEPREYISVDKKQMRKEIADKYKVDPSILWIVGMGTVSKRKGVDIFMNICRQLQKASTPAHFFWIGNFTDAELKRNADREVAAGHMKNITFTGPMPYDIHTILPFDIFLLTSREDPYPLVVLEAACNGVPSICFESSGGITEFLADDCGWIVPGFSEEQMVEKLKALTIDSEEIVTVGQRAKERFLNWHANGEAIVSQFDKILQKANK